MANISGKKRMRNALLACVGLFSLLAVRIGYIQFVQGEELQTLAYMQQTLDRMINPNRGTIYDRNGTVLAMSASVETVTINPTNISEGNKEKVAQSLSNIFELDYESVLKKVNKKTSIETIIKKVDKEKTDKLREWMNSTGITAGINIDEDTKRYYPYGSLASHIIGFTGSDNQGLDGIEAKYNEILSGTQGKIVRTSDASGSVIGTGEEEYIPAVDGDSLVLSIDANVQSIATKYLEEACIDNECTDGGVVIIMQPDTGDVLAMATYPEYDLNDPFTINSEEIKSSWDSLSQTDKNIQLQQMWRNKAITDTYEPGSTFKLITTSIALEEKIVTDIDKPGQFTCTGGIDIAGTYIKCWRYYRPHGAESLRDALMNSCNPVFIGLGQKVGVKKYYEYLEKFGLLNKTGIDLSGEAGSIFLAEEKVGPVELATLSFGQRFEVTPIQLITAVSAIANGGKLVTPRFVTATVDSETGEKTEIEPSIKNEVISEETASKVRDMMESVVAEGTGKNAKVEGYSIGGKTGTSEDGVNTNKYVTSFMGLSPADDPEIVILVVLYNPTGEGGHQGGAVAAPVAGNILSEVLPYLETEKQEEKEKVTVPNVVGMTVKEAKSELKKVELDIKINNQPENLNESEAIITEQIPNAGITQEKNGYIICEIK